MKYKLLIFDLDDTLIDYQLTEFKALEIIHQKFFKKIVGFDGFKEKFEQVNNNIWDKYRSQKIDLSELRWKRFKKLNDIFQTDVNVNSVKEMYETCLAEYIYPFPDTREILESLMEKYTLSLLTDGIASIQRKKLEKTHLINMFSFIIISEEVGFRKPSAELFNHVLQLVKVGHDEALMIGDSLESDLVGAENAGIDFCWLNRRQNKLPSQFPKPRFVIHDLKELIDYL